jgi:hypothetical protein
MIVNKSSLFSLNTSIHNKQKLLKLNLHSEQNPKFVLYQITFSTNRLWGKFQLYMQGSNKIIWKQDDEQLGQKWQRGNSYNEELEDLKVKVTKYITRMEKCTLKPSRFETKWKIRFGIHVVSNDWKRNTDQNLPPLLNIYRNPILQVSRGSLVTIIITVFAGWPGLNAWRGEMFLPPHPMWTLPSN